MAKIDKIYAPNIVKKTSKNNSDWKFAYSLLSPSILILVLIIIYPIIMTFITAFQGQNGFTLNFGKNVLNDENLLPVLIQSAIWTFGGTGIIFFVSLILALSLNESFLGYKAARIMLLLPWATPIAVSALVWRWVFNDQYGILNYLLSALNVIDGNIAWLAMGNTGFLANLIVEIWSGLPLMTLILLAGLQSMPEEVYEAATVDGASWLQSLVSITLPLMRPVFFVAILMFIIWTFNSFPVIWIITRGGPLNSTDTLVTYIYKIAFQYNLFNEAAFLSVITFIIMLLISIPYVRLYFKQEE